MTEKEKDAMALAAGAVEDADVCSGAVKTCAKALAVAAFLYARREGPAAFRRAAELAMEAEDDAGAAGACTKLDVRFAEYEKEESPSRGDEADVAVMYYKIYKIADAATRRDAAMCAAYAMARAHWLEETDGDPGAEAGGMFSGKYRFL